MTHDDSAESRAAWSTVAPGWERRSDFIWAASREVGERLVTLLDPQPGETILELAAGPGDTGFAAARLVAPGGRLLSTDFAPEMVATSRRRAGALGLGNVEHRVVDAQAIELPDSSVDGVLCRWGYMLMPDPARALAETWRVLRPGGRLAFSVWADAADNPWGSAVGRALVELGLIERPAPDAPGPFRFGDVERLRSLVTAAGFEQPQVEDAPLTWRYPAFEEYWQVTSDLSFLLATALRTLDAVDVERVRARAREALRPYEDGGGQLELPGLSRNVLARKR